MESISAIASDGALKKPRPDPCICISFNELGVEAITGA
jgi:hypothetical protein